MSCEMGKIKSWHIAIFWDLQLFNRHDAWSNIAAKPWAFEPNTNVLADVSSNQMLQNENWFTILQRFDFDIDQKMESYIV